MWSVGARVVIAATHSGAGKTTIATGLMAAFRERGVRVASAKVGPDFIDPGYHSAATGRPGRNLDAWICGAEAIVPLAARATQSCDILIVEGVMGLFDGAADASPGAGAADASTAHVARLLDAPVILVVDAAAMSGSVAALVRGFSTFDPSVRVEGVILNRVGSPSHADALHKALADVGVRVVGTLLRDDALVWRDRHLGLVPVVEQRGDVGRSLGRLRAVIARDCDLDQIHAIARSAPPLVADALPTPTRRGRVRVAVAAGPAFSFYYPDNLEALEAAGAELAPFDPTEADDLPDGVDALYVGGGFPEVFVSALAANAPLLDAVRSRVHSGLVTWAECGGLLWLSRSLDGRRLCAVLPATATMTDRLTLGYRRAIPRVSSALGPAGSPMRGHEFHYSRLDPPGDAVDVRGRDGASTAGFATPTLFASYLHLHLGANPEVAERFVAAADRARTRREAAR